MSEGNMPEDWIGETVEAFPDSENLVVQGSLEGITEHGVVINVASRIAAVVAGGQNGPHFYSWRGFAPKFHPAPELQSLQQNYNVSAGPGVSDALAAGGVMPAGVWL